MGEQLAGHEVGVDLATVVDLHQGLVLHLERGDDLVVQQVGVQQVSDPDADSIDLVGVGRADAASGGADPLPARETLGDLVQGLVIGRDEVRVGADQRMFDDLATGSQPIQLVVKHVKVDDHAVPDDGGGVAIENACGQQVHDELLATHHDGVAGVVATGVAHHQIDVLTQRVDRLALALVTPLGSQHDDARHAQPFVQAPGDATRNTTEAPCTATAARGSCHATLTRQGLARPEF